MDTPRSQDHVALPDPDTLRVAAYIEKMRRADKEIEARLQDAIVVVFEPPEAAKHAAVYFNDRRVGTLSDYHAAQYIAAAPRLLRAALTQLRELQRERDQIRIYYERVADNFYAEQRLRVAAEAQLAAFAAEIDELKKLLEAQNR